MGAKRKAKWKYVLSQFSSGVIENKLTVASLPKKPFTLFEKDIYVEMIDKIIKSEVTFFIFEAKEGVQYEGVFTSFMRTFCENKLKSYISLALFSKCVYKDIMAANMLFHLDDIKNEATSKVSTNIEITFDISLGIINKILEKEVKILSNISLDSYCLLNSFLYNEIYCSATKTLARYHCANSITNELINPQHLSLYTNHLCKTIWTEVNIVRSMIRGKLKTEMQKIGYHEISAIKWVDQFISKVLIAIYSSYLGKSKKNDYLSKSINENLLSNAVRSYLQEIGQVEYKKSFETSEAKTCREKFSSLFLSNIIKDLNIKIANSLLVSHKIFENMIKEQTDKIIKNSNANIRISFEIASLWINAEIPRTISEITKSQSNIKLNITSIYNQIENNMLSQNIAAIVNNSIMRNKITSKIYTDITTNILKIILQEHMKQHQTTQKQVNLKISDNIYERIIIKLLSNLLKMDKLIYRTAMSPIESRTKMLIKATYEQISIIYSIIIDHGTIILLANIIQKSIDNAKVFEEVYNDYLLKNVCRNLIQEIINHPKETKKYITDVVQKLTEKSVTYSTLTICKATLKEYNMQQNVSQLIAGKFIDSEMHIQLIKYFSEIFIADELIKNAMKLTIQSECVIPLISIKKDLTLEMEIVDEEISFGIVKFLQDFLLSADLIKQISCKIYREIAEYQFYIEWTACICYSTMEEHDLALFITDYLIEETIRGVISEIKSGVKIVSDAYLSLCLYQVLLSGYISRVCQLVIENATVANYAVDSLLIKRKDYIKNIGYSIICSKNILVDSISAKTVENGKKHWISLLITDDILQRGVKYICVKSLRELKKQMAAKKLQEKNIIFLKAKITENLIQQTVKNIATQYPKELINSARFSINLSTAINNALVRICVKRIARSNLHLLKIAGNCANDLLQYHISKTFYTFFQQCIIAIMIESNVIGKNIHHLIRAECRNIINECNEKKAVPIVKELKITAKNTQLIKQVKMQEKKHNLEQQEVEEVKGSNNINDINVSIFELSKLISQKKQSLKHNPDLEQSCTELNEICSEAMKHNTVFIYYKLIIVECSFIGNIACKSSKTTCCNWISLIIN